MLSLNRIKDEILLIIMTILLGTLLAQALVIGLSLLSVINGINFPLLLEKTTVHDEILFKAEPILIVMSYATAGVIVRYIKPHRRF
ncbi:hypothetical protein [Pyrococcus sp. ST04]|uniref:hypothetical protein n=1 Tax=Pyrococcus sp. ST04 TaxID=1183377 RepID=UPI00064F2F31|nr:hypothetical protein [Pyrococcus sp. ST04]